MRAESLVIQAGAGTGKTHALVELCVELLGAADPLPPARLCAVTFTEKAAAELKGRIRARVDELAVRDERFRRLRRELGAAQVGTIHSLCAQILRRHAAAAGIDPGFALLDESQARRMLREACEHTALRTLEGALGLEAELAARRLCAEIGLRATGKFVRGLADELTGLLASLGESGRSPLELLAQTAGLRSAQADDERARRELLRALAELRAALPDAKISTDLPLDYAPGSLRAAWPRLQRKLPELASRGAAADAIRAAKEARIALLEADAGVRAAGLAADLTLIAERAAERHRLGKARAGALDFDDLTRLCRDLLARVPAARDAERERLGVLLVDEFQDTSRTQMELFSLLAGGRPLAIVGDAKQSIYDFRGADVEGAQRFAGQLLAGGAERRVLGVSRRSRPALVELTNLLFQRALRPAFSADDALASARPRGPGGACAELLNVAGAGVDAEAEIVARRIAALLQPDAPERVFGDEEQPRAVRGGDIAILLRRFTNLDAFRRALLRRRIPHLVHRGRGFHQSREVLDLLALLALVVDPDDSLALAAVLRSPVGPLSDDGLALLALQNGRLDRRALRARPPALAPDDADALERIVRLLLALQREADRLGPAALLQVALEETDYLAACAAGLYGEQAAANVDKLVSLARDAEQRGDGVRAFVASLRELAEEEAREPDAAVVEESDPHAVRIMTVHAAKGLEFPVVVVPECAAPSFRMGADRVLLDAELGIAVKARAADGARRWGPHGERLRARKEERELAQSRRLFYVAATRARDFLVLSGRAAKGQEECWRAFIDAIANEAEERGLLRICREPAALEPRARQGPAVDCERMAELPPGQHRDVERIAAGRAAPAQPTICAAVTQIADALECPRRYQLLHELRIPERPDADPELPDPLSDEASAPVTALGSLAHRLLELAPLRLDAAARRAELSRLLDLEGEDPARHSELLDAASAFLDSPLGQRMAKARPEHLKRELPFALRLSAPDRPELLVRGQIDALLLEEGAATVVDYKLSRARELTRYQAQLDAYALAARELTASALPVRAGIVFLRSRGAPFAEHAPAELAQIGQGLLEAASAVAEGRRSGNWPMARIERCRDLSCGFLRRCHPDASAS